MKFVLSIFFCCAYINASTIRECNFAGDNNFFERVFLKHSCYKFCMHLCLSKTLSQNCPHGEIKPGMQMHGGHTDQFKEFATRFKPHAVDFRCTLCSVNDVSGKDPWVFSASLGAIYLERPPQMSIYSFWGGLSRWNASTEARKTTRGPSRGSFTETSLTFHSVE